MDLTPFDVYRYLKEIFFENNKEPYMLVLGVVYR